jgi:hypothetical protein
MGGVRGSVGLVVGDGAVRGSLEREVDGRQDAEVAGRSSGERFGC